MLSPEVIALAERLAGLLPASLQRVQLLNTGGEANEAAIRMAKSPPGGSRSSACPARGTAPPAGSATYAHGRKRYGPVMPGSLTLPAPNAYRRPIRHCRERCDRSCLDVGFDMIDAASVGEEAAVIAEPIQSAGGIVEPPAGYFERLRELCAERGILLISTKRRPPQAHRGDVRLRALWRGAGPVDAIEDAGRRLTPVGTDRRRRHCRHRPRARVLALHFAAPIR